MSRLHIYTVHVNPALPHPYESAEFIEEGFSVKAFLFPALWALAQRLWREAALLVFAEGSLFWLSSHSAVTHAGIFILQLGIGLVAGFQGNDWRRTRAKRLGYLTSDIVTGDSSLRAELRFFDRHFASDKRAVL